MITMKSYVVMRLNRINRLCIQQQTVLEYYVKCLEAVKTNENKLVANRYRKAIKRTIRRSHLLDKQFHDIYRTINPNNKIEIINALDQISAN